MKKAHVPAFGNWEATGNVPYTQYFERVVNNKTTKKASSPDECSKTQEDHAHDAPTTKKAPIPTFGNWETTGNVPYTQYFELVVDNKTTKKASSPDECRKAQEAHARDAPTTKKAPLPAFGNWEAAGSIPCTQSFELVVTNKGTTKGSKPNKFSKTPEAHAHDASTTIDAISHKVVPNHEDPKPSKASKPEDALQVEKENSVHQTAAFVLDNQVKVPSSEGAKRITKKRPIHQGYTTSGVEVIVPPFGDWEKNPESSRKYTKIFQLIGDSRRYPGISIQLPLEETPEQDNTESKGCCGCLRNFFK